MIHFSSVFTHFLIKNYQILLFSKSKYLFYPHFLSMRFLYFNKLMLYFACFYFVQILGELTNFLIFRIILAKDFFKLICYFLLFLSFCYILFSAKVFLLNTLMNDLLNFFIKGFFEVQQFHVLITGKLYFSNWYHQLWSFLHLDFFMVKFDFINHL